jgi:2'-5' RNA ligase
MLLSVAFVPPAGVLDDLNAVVDAAGGGPGDLERIPSAHMQLSVAAFGNVARSETAQLSSTLSRLAAGWPPVPTLNFAGGAALEWPGDQHVWAKLDGGVDELQAVAASIAPAMLRLGYAIDRRRFRPWLPLGTVTPTTRLDFLERLLAALDSYQGAPWEATHLSLVRPVFDDARSGAPAFEVVREFALPTE